MDIDNWPSFFVFTVIAVLTQQLVWQLGSTLVERLTGRQREPENRIYFAGAFVFGSSIIVVALIPLVAEDFVHSVAVMLAAIMIGDLLAQSLFGKKTFAVDSP